MTMLVHLINDSNSGQRRRHRETASGGLFVCGPFIAVKVKNRKQPAMERVKELP